MTIAWDEWLTELEKAQSHSDEGNTAEEIADTLKCGKTRVTRILHMANKSGSLIVGKRFITTIDGRTVRVPVYKVKKGKKGEKVVR